MKSVILIIVSICFSISLKAQLSKTINVTAGGLYSALTVDEKRSITSLTVTGTIDASDFKTMRDNMPLLAVLDLSGTTVESYTGQLGTFSNNGNDWTYPSNTIPEASFNKNKPNFISFTFPSNVTSIGDGAFSGCSKITSIEIPSSVTSINGAAFSGCSGLTSIEIPSGVTEIKETVFMGCSGLTAYVIPDQITSIGIQAFANCAGLTSITIPSGVTYIGTQAFSDCVKLTSVVVYHTTPLILGSGIMGKSTAIFNLVNKNTCILYVPVGSLNAYRTAIQWKDFNNVVEFSPTNAELTNTNEIIIYPIPCEAGCRITGINSVSKLNITNLDGRLIYTRVIDKDEYLPLNYLQRGTYLVSITSNSERIVRKLVKK